jgi:hypothetical protein
MNIAGLWKTLVCVARTIVKKGRQQFLQQNEESKSSPCPSKEWMEKERGTIEKFIGKTEPEAWRSFAPPEKRLRSG